jgi:hypothetical protein
VKPAQTFLTLRCRTYVTRSHEVDARFRTHEHVSGRALAGIRRRGRSCYRSQLAFCRQFYEVAHSLGMRLRFRDPRRDQVAPREAAQSYHAAPPRNLNHHHATAAAASSSAAYHGQRLGLSA